MGGTALGGESSCCNMEHVGGRRSGLRRPRVPLSQTRAPPRHQMSPDLCAGHVIGDSEPCGRSGGAPNPEEGQTCSRGQSAHSPVSLEPCSPPPDNQLLGTVTFKFSLDVDKFKKSPVIWNVANRKEVRVAGDCHRPPRPCTRSLSLCQPPAAPCRAFLPCCVLLSTPKPPGLWGRGPGLETRRPPPHCQASLRP